VLDIPYRMSAGLIACCNLQLVRISCPTAVAAVSLSTCRCLASSFELPRMAQFYITIDKVSHLHSAMEEALCEL
jgi:hypothetical protein